MTTIQHDEVAAKWDITSNPLDNSDEKIFHAAYNNIVTPQF
jgi:hypothetical protein